MAPRCASAAPPQRRIKPPRSGEKNRCGRWRPIAKGRTALYSGGILTIRALGPSKSAMPLSSERARSELNGIADFDGPSARMVKIPPEYNAVRPFAIGRQRPQRFFSPLRGGLIRRCGGAAGAQPRAMKIDCADAEMIQLIFLIRRTSREDDVGPEAVHRQRLRQARVQIGERRFGNSQEGICMRQRDS